MEALLERGSLRIGTLYEYKQIEDFGDETYDPNEGLKRVSGDIEPGRRPTSLLPLIDVGNASGGYIRNCSYQLPDQLVFSTSLKYSEDAHRKWFEKSGYDACYEILNASAFFASVNRAVREKYGNDYRYEYYHEVDYRDEIGIYEPSVKLGRHLKGKKFVHQAEVRAIWIPTRNIDLKGFVLDHSSAGTVCRGFRVISP